MHIPRYKQGQELAGQKKEEHFLSTKNCISPEIPNHNWAQKGPYLVCMSCKRRHAIYIGLTKKIKQIKKDGEVILEDIGYS